MRSAAAAPADEVLADLGTGAVGLSSAEAGRRRSDLGPNAVRTHRASAWPVLVRQVRSPLLGLLALTAAASFFLGERADAVIIGVILVLSVALGFVNEYRAEKEAAARPVTRPSPSPRVYADRTSHDAVIRATPRTTSSTDGNQPQP